MTTIKWKLFQLQSGEKIVSFQFACSPDQMSSGNKIKRFYHFSPCSQKSSKQHQLEYPGSNFSISDNLSIQVSCHSYTFWLFTSTIFSSNNRKIPKVWLQVEGGKLQTLRTKVTSRVQFEKHTCATEPLLRQQRFLNGETGKQTEYTKYTQCMPRSAALKRKCLKRSSIQIDIMVSSTLH